MGTRLISLKGQSMTWMGQSNLSVSDRGLRRFLRLRNAYVSPDGSEIRSFPGFYPLWDNTPEANPDGWAGRYTTDMVRPIFRTVNEGAYRRGYQVSSSADAQLQTLRARALPAHYHGFEQIGGALVVWGESRFREVPIYTAARQVIKVISVTNSGATWVLNLSGVMATATAADVSGPGLNSMDAGPRSIYLEGLELADQSTAPQQLKQAVIDAELNGKVHMTTGALTGNTLTLTSLSQTSNMTSEVLLTSAARSIHVVRGNRDGIYPTAFGEQRTPYGTTSLTRVDDPDALTTWRIVEPLGGSSSVVPCHPAWVANRRRDCGDRVSLGYNEGVPVTLGPPAVWASRREQRSLPFRTNSDAATDRLILAAPGYSCMFQVPLKVGTNPGAWPDNQSMGTYGWPIDGNSIYDIPRSLGIPKARMVVAPDGADLPTSVGQTTPHNFLAETVAGVGGVGQGVWKVSISYSDDGTGEEGLASETAEVNIDRPPTPVGSFVWALRINYIHPGYIMPECMATRINVYIAPPGQDALSFYASFPLPEDPFTGDNSLLNGGLINSQYKNSGFYGWEPQSDQANIHAIFRSFRLPLVGTGEDVAEILDPERQAPQSASMPRGADACRYLRGVLMAGGNTGNVGSTGGLWSSVARVHFDPSLAAPFVLPFDRSDEYQIRVHGDNYGAQSGGQDGDIDTSSFGGGGRCFPDAYQGVEVVSRGMFPDGGQIQRVDQVRNRKAEVISESIANAANSHIQTERISVTRGITNRTLPAGSAPASTTINTGPNPVYYIMPKGQMQIGDPGAPWRSSKSFIQFVDANRGDDITAIGNVAGTGVVCTMRETYSFSWYRNPGGEIPNLVSNEHGCIAANSMVEFDGGCAWLGERGPVAMGSGLQFIGADIQEDFTGATRRYLFDSKGMMRHSWGCHDAALGIVMWGLITADGTQGVSYQGGPSLEYDGIGVSDQHKSRFPCDEVLIWSYRTSSFSTWRPPAGLEIYWMRQVRIASGEAVIAFLAADGNIYALADTYSDSAATPLDYVLTADALGATVTVNYISGTVPWTTPGLDGVLKRFRPGMRVEQFRDGRLIGATTIEFVVSVGETSATFTTFAPVLTLLKGDTVRVGARPPVEIITNYIGAETMDNLSAQSLQMRYSLLGEQDGHAKVSALVTDYRAHKEVSMGPWESLGVTNSVANSPRLGARKEFNRGGWDSPEGALKLEFTGKGQLRIGDLAFEVG